MKYETNCERISESLISYLDGRANAAEQHEVEAHAVVCSACKTRIAEFRSLSVVLDELPKMQPSGAFDAHVRQRIAGEPRTLRFGWLIPAPRLAFSLAALLSFSVWTASLEPRVPEAPANSAQSEQDFRLIKDLDVLENYDVVKNFDALSELPAALPAAQQGQVQPEQQKSED